MASDVVFRIGGEAGQGVESSGAGFAMALTRGGYHVAAVPDYYSRIRGGHNFFTIRASDEPVHAAREAVHVLVALDGETVARHATSLAPGAAVIIDEGTPLDPALVAGRDVRLLSLPLVRIAEENGNRVMLNTGALAAAATLVGFPLEPMLGVIADSFGRKGGAIIEANRRVALDTAAAVRQRSPEPFGWQLPVRSAPAQLVTDCNRAFAMGAMMGGCRFVAGYPMTPSTSVLEYMAAHADAWGLVVKHAEDEIGAVNMCIGAAHVGARAVLATSGGGFDLMVEAISLSAMIETPLVIYLAQRPGPATGLATRTAQADLLMSLFCSHGEFARVVLAPHTPEEAFACGYRALNLSEQYQCVVLVLSDHYNATTLLSRDPAAFDPQRVTVDRGKLVSAQELEAIDDYLRFAITEDGVSPRAIAGTSPKAVYLASSDEHREDGHISEDADVVEAMTAKRLRKRESALKEMRGPLRYGPETADLTLVAWGSTFGSALEAMEERNRQGKSTNLLQFVDLWPFPAEATRRALEGAGRIVAIEGNATGQLAFLLQACAGIGVHGKVLRFDGRGFTPEYILARLGDG